MTPTTIAIIQARMGSDRLPGKVLSNIAGKTMLARVLERAKQVPDIDQVVVATTAHGRDDVLVKACQALGCEVFRGSEQDVLARYYLCARQYQADTVVRITSDCPLLAPEVVGKVLQSFNQQQPDYASNSLTRTYPRGLDVEVMRFSALETAWQQATKAEQREHVTLYIYQHPEQFKLLPVTHDLDYSGYRWTIDTEDDLAMVRALYQCCPQADTLTWQELIDVFQEHPDIAQINRHIQQKSVNA